MKRETRTDGLMSYELLKKLIEGIRSNKKNPNSDELSDDWIIAISPKSDGNFYTRVHSFKQGGDDLECDLKSNFVAGILCFVTKMSAGQIAYITSNARMHTAGKYAWLIMPGCEKSSRVELNSANGFIDMIQQKREQK